MTERIQSHGQPSKVRPRLYAMFAALTMMATVAIPSALPKTANADQATEAGICTPEDMTLGENISTNQPDTGVATWVGRDMYIGGRPAGTSLDLTKESPTISFAAEAEGLTLVRGKLAIAKDGGSWGGNGFRFGRVGFGADFRPSTSNDGAALAVAGLDSNISRLPLGDRTGTEETTATVAAWKEGTHRGGAFVGKGDSDSIAYQAYIAGPYTHVVNNNSVDSLRANMTDTDGGSLVHWNQSGTDALKINGTNYTNYTTDVQTMSTSLSKAQAYGTAVDQSQNPGTKNSTTAAPGVYYGKGTNDSVEIKHYKYPNDYKYTFNYTSTYNTNLITFQGDGESTMQVFNLDASKLNQTTFFDETSGTVTGVEFAFSNIPDDASIAINVSGSSVQFHTGWRFWWLGKQIQGQWTSSEYGTAAQKIMWNFYEAKDSGDAPALKILGGVYNSEDTTSFSSATAEQKAEYGLGDDPAAAMLGSIMVPKGSFDDHVTTNGRVWVGVDFMMNNPVWVAKGTGFDGASKIGMDQERHNFSWYGSVQSTCSTLAWAKSDDSGKLLAGSVWGVYGSVENAAKKDHAFYNVKDNQVNTGDWDSDDGKFQVNSLNPGYDYFIREIEAPSGYAITDMIYKIHATEKGDVLNNTITGAWKVNSDGSTTEIKDSTQWGLTTVTDSTGTVQAIVNKPEGSAVAWGKYDGTIADSSKYQGLAGSEWTLTLPDGTKHTVTDNTRSVTAVSIFRDDKNVTGTTIDVSNSESLQFSATVYAGEEEAGNQVTWSASNPDIVSVSDGYVTVLQVPESGETVDIIATSVATDANGQAISNKVTLKIIPLACTSLTATYNNQNVNGQTVQLSVGGHATVVANAEPGECKVYWNSSNVNVATVESGVVTAKAAGSSTITISAAGQTPITFMVTVTDTNTHIYFNKNQTGFTGNLYVYWKASGSNDWQYSNLMTDACGGTYATTSIPNNLGAFEFYISRDKKDDKTNTYKGDGESPWNVAANVANFTANQYNQTATSAPGCVTQTASVSESASTVAVYRRSAQTATVRNVNEAVENDVVALADSVDDNPYQDMDTAVGKFRLEQLDDGKYMLQESKAPVGFFLNPTVYEFTITNGKVNWADGKSPTMVGDNAWIPDYPTEISFAKLDGGYDAENAVVTGDPLAGSKWELEMFDGENYQHHSDIEDCVADSADKCTGADADHRAGQFKLEKLGVGKYRLHETDAPAGYELDSDSYYYFEHDTAPAEGTVVTWTKATKDHDTDGKPTKQATVQSAGNYVNFAYNFRKTGSVNWVKVEEGSPTKVLGGSEWTLERKDGETWTTVDPATITDCTGTCETTGDQDAESGHFEIKNLQWGDYRLTETKAPDGYNLSDKTYTFTIDATHLTDIKIKVDGADLQDGNLIENTPGVILPETGGTGVNMALVYLGVVLVGIAMMGCGIVLRKQA